MLDSATGEDGDKQFYTITTEAGNVFYLIIDGKRDDNNVLLSEWRHRGGPDGPCGKE